jgi:hypothetical protein
LDDGSNVGKPLFLSGTWKVDFGKFPLDPDPGSVELTQNPVFGMTRSRNQHVK